MWSTSRRNWLTKFPGSESTWLNTDTMFRPAWKWTLSRCVTFSSISIRMYFHCKWPNTNNSWDSSHRWSGDGWMLKILTETGNTLRSSKKMRRRSKSTTLGFLPYTMNGCPKSQLVCEFSELRASFSKTVNFIHQKMEMILDKDVCGPLLLSFTKILIGCRMNFFLNELFLCATFYCCENRAREVIVALWKSHEYSSTVWALRHHHPRVRN